MSDNLTAGNPRAHRVRLYYTENSTIYEGMPVCYEFDATTNWFGGSVSDGAVTATTTTAEGSHNEGKYIRVEDPDADNVHAFAGVVTKGGWCGQTGPLALDVYVPNGAIVPVRADQACVVGQTILCVNSAEQHLTAPHGDTSRPVAVAMETDDTDVTTGLVLAELNPDRFIYQRGDGNALLVDDIDTDWQRVNTLQIESAGSQWLEAFGLSMDFLAAGTNTGIVINADLNMYQTACAGYSTAIQGSVYFQSGFVATTGGCRGLSAKLKDEATVNLTGMTNSVLFLEHFIRAASTGPDSSSMIGLNATAGTNAPDFFINSQNPSALVYSESAATAGTKCGAIKCYCAGATTATFYIRTYTSAV